MRDKYFEMAKQDGYRARSAYKLKEIQENFELIKPGMNICDIWAAPGSFIQYMKRIISDTGVIVGIDLKPIAKYSQKNIITLEHDIFECDSLRVKIIELLEDVALKESLRNKKTLTERLVSSSWNSKLETSLEKIKWLSQVLNKSSSPAKESVYFDLITSDIAPNTTGRKDIDQYASVELNIEVLKFADIFLKTWWNLLLKVFKGEDFWDLTQEIHKRYQRFTEFKPYACRDRSFEEYLICFGKK